MGYLKYDFIFFNIQKRREIWIHKMNGERSENEMVCLFVESTISSERRKELGLGLYQLLIWKIKAKVNILYL